MHLFHSPWLRNNASRNPSRTPRTGTAHRIALLLQEEAQKKPVLQLEAAPAPVLVDVVDIPPAVAA